MPEKNIDHIRTEIINLFNQWSSHSIEQIISLPHSGSNRIYFRITSKNCSFIAVYNSDIQENIAFIDFTKQFQKCRINIPEILFIDQNKEIYFLTDLGDISLLNWLQENHFTEQAKNLYKSVLKELIKFQIIAGKEFDYSNCYPFKEFDKDSIFYDLNYFKDQFVDNLNIAANSEKLQKEFNEFAKYLLSEDNHYFMYRDFQARNIMLHNNVPFFIDYQGGRKGPLQYDVASLLYQAKAEIPEEIKTELLDYYIHLIRMYIPVNTDEFKKYFYAFALIRVLQTLGAYGLRGIKEQKQHFIESIPKAINNLKKLIHKVEFIQNLQELKSLIETIIHSEIQIHIKNVNSNN